MASPTTNKAYTYAGHGGSVGSWDTQLNGNIEAQDLNLGGPYPITASTTTAAITYNTSYATIPSTVQSITLSASLAQNLFYNLTGTLGSSLNINMPAVGSIYVFGNNVTVGSSYAVAVQPTGGSAVTLTSGGQAMVVTTSTGANFAQNAFGAISALSVATSSGLTVGGAATVTGALTQNSSQYGQIASGPTASRPAVTAAYFRYNSTLVQPEWSDGVSWYPIGAQPVASGFKNLSITNNAGTPNTSITFAADALTVETSAGTEYRLSSFAATIDCTVTGANGLDAGGLANTTWYSIWAIYNPTTGTAAGLASTSATAPTLPAGYTAQARFGWMRTDGSAHFMRTLQYGRIAQYIVGTNPSVARTINNGPAGTYSVTSPTLTTVSITSFVPTTASRIHVAVENLFQNSAISSVLVAPNTAWGGTFRGPRGSAGQVYPLWIDNGSGVGYSDWLTLEATTIAWASSAAGGAIVCLGWEDNL